MPECRICHMPINKEHADWIMPSKNYYYHTNCYNTWKAAPSTDEDWVLMIYDFLARDLKVKYDWHTCDAQIKKFWKENKINPKGIYFTLKYYYEIKGNPWIDSKTHGGIGIVPFVFDAARSYWIEQEQRHRGFIKSLEQEAKVKTIQRITRDATIKKDKYNLDDIGGEE